MSGREMLYFGEFTEAEMDEARRCAVEAMKKYGDLVGEEYERFLANPWNDHCSVQAAMRAVHSPLRTSLGEPDNDTVERAAKALRQSIYERHGVTRDKQEDRDDARAALAAIGSGTQGRDAVIICDGCPTPRTCEVNAECLAAKFRALASPEKVTDERSDRPAEFEPMLLGGSGDRSDYSRNNPDPVTPAAASDLRERAEEFISALDNRRRNPDKAADYCDAVTIVMSWFAAIRAEAETEARNISVRLIAEAKAEPTWDDCVALVRRSNEVVRYSQSGESLADWLATNKPAGREPVTPLAASDLRERESQFIKDYIEGYEFRSDGGDHVPTEDEHVLLIDAIAGLVDDPQFRALITAVDHAAIRAEAKAEGWEDARQECRQVAFDRHTDVSSDFDEGYDSAVADIVADIEAIAANRPTGRED